MQLTTHLPPSLLLLSPHRQATFAALTCYSSSASSSATPTTRTTIMGKKRSAAAPSSPEKAPQVEGRGDSSPRKPAASRAAGSPDQMSLPPPLTLKQRLLPAGGLLPWWVSTVFSIYALVQFGMMLEHPCGILGVSQISRSTISRAYRQISVCTHPDKLVGHSDTDIRRGDLLFKRASSARDMLLAVQRQAVALEEAALAANMTAPQEPRCQSHLDDMIVEWLRYIFGSMVEIGPAAMTWAAGQFLFELVTLEYDITTTISLALLLVTLIRTIMNLLGYLLTTGPITTVVSAFTTVVIGPLPTLARFILLPPMRILAFVKHDLRPFLQGADSAIDTEADGGGDGSGLVERAVGSSGVDEDDMETVDDADEVVGGTDDSASAATAGNGLRQRKGAGAAPAVGGGGATPAMGGAVGAGANREAPKRGLKQRGRPESAAELQAQREALLRGDVLQHGMPVADLASMRVWEVLCRKPLPHSRAAAAAAIQFDLLLSITKHVIPLAALVATKQVFNGLWSSMVRTVPSLRASAPPACPEWHLSCVRRALPPS